MSKAFPLGRRIYQAYCQKLRIEDAVVPFSQGLAGCGAKMQAAEEPTWVPKSVFGLARTPVQPDLNQ